MSIGSLKISAVATRESLKFSSPSAALDAMLAAKRAIEALPPNSLAPFWVTESEWNGLVRRNKDIEVPVGTESTNSCSVLPIQVVKDKYAPYVLHLRALQQERMNRLYAVPIHKP